MNSPKKTYIIICEGISEKSYIAELNRFLDAQDAKITLVPKPAECGHFSIIQKKYKQIKKENKREEIYIWVDKDTYIRNDNNDKVSYRQKKIPDFLFTNFNFEDFLVMHLPKEKLEKWREICRRHNHFTTPMHANTYEPLYIQNIFPNYKKGDMPIEINEENLKLAIERQNDPTIEFKCDFLNLIKPYIE